MLLEEFLLYANPQVGVFKGKINKERNVQFVLLNPQTLQTLICTEASGSPYMDNAPNICYVKKENKQKKTKH